MNFPIPILILLELCVTKMDGSLQFTLKICWKNFLLTHSLQHVKCATDSYHLLRRAQKGFVENTHQSEAYRSEFEFWMNDALSLKINRKQNEVAWRKWNRKKNEILMSPRWIVNKWRCICAEIFPQLLSTRVPGSRVVLKFLNDFSLFGSVSIRLVGSQKRHTKST